MASDYGSLLLKRSTGDSFQLVTSDGPITVTVVDMLIGSRGRREYRIRVDAPKSVRILRSELLAEGAVPA